MSLNVRFSNRMDAAEQLAYRLQAWQESHPLVLAIPRGALPIGRLLADRLNGELDVVLVRKLGAPRGPELAIGSIDESGWTYIAPYARSVGADEAYIEKEKRAQLSVLQERRKRYTPNRAPIDTAGRVVIIVDDGLATGATMLAALHAVRARQPAKLICAVPVASTEGLALVQSLADEVVCLHAPQDFGAVGYFYRSFAQVEDEQAIRLLNERGGNAC